MQTLTSDLGRETQRLYEKVHKLGWTRENRKLMAPITLQIGELKKNQNTLILTHRYQTPDIMYGVGDHLGGSCRFSVMATKHAAKKINSCSVYFIGENAKLLHPDKEMLVPKVAGCSLADSIICILCPCVNEIQLDDVLKATKGPEPEPFIEILADIAELARAGLTRVFEFEKQEKSILQKRDGSSFTPAHGDAPAWSSSTSFLTKWAASTPTNLQSRRNIP